MFTLKNYITVIGFVLLGNHIPAQNLTGTWEGDLGNDQFLQLNILQTGNKICGYTRDHVKNDKRSFCKAFFEGYFDKQKMKLIISGKYFLQNSGSHTLMNLSLAYKKEKGVEILEQKPPTPSRLSSIFSDLGIFFYDDPFAANDDMEYVHIKKVADRPYEIIDLMRDCIAGDKQKPDTEVKKIPLPKPKDSIPLPAKISIPEKAKDSIPPVVLAPVKKDSSAIPKTVIQRKNKEQGHIEVNTKYINLKVYDNAIMDGDTVSILYNGKMLLTHQLLSERGIELNIELDENQTRHEIILFAENLGSIPPNTALVVITAGDKRYELFASASLEENAVLVFDYRPR